MRTPLGIVPIAPRKSPLRRANDFIMFNSTCDRCFKHKSKYFKMTFVDCTTNKQKSFKHKEKQNNRKIRLFLSLSLTRSDGVSRAAASNRRALSLASPCSENARRAARNAADSNGIGSIIVDTIAFCEANRDGKKRRQRSISYNNNNKIK